MARSPLYPAWRSSLVKSSAERCSGGPSRSYHGKGNRQHSRPERMLELSGVSGGGTLGKSKAEQERSYLAAEPGEGRGYKAGRLKSHGAGRKRQCLVAYSAGPGTQAPAGSDAICASVSNPGELLIMLGAEKANKLWEGLTK